MLYEQYYDFKRYAPELGQIAQGNVKIFNDWWDTYVKDYKETLQTKILHTYWFNQIGQETPDRFIWMLNATLERIMPYYNQLYKSELIKIDPILNHFLESNNRSIENMVREANTGTSKASKSIKDFVNSGNTQGTSNTDFSGDYTRTLDKDVVTDYTKDGTEDKVQDTTSNEKQLTEYSKDGTEDKIQDTISNEKQVTDTDQTRELERTEDNQKDVTGNETEQTDRSTDGTKNVTGTETTNETISFTRGETRLYSDTPQRNTSTLGIDSNYLTNYTSTNTTENTTRNQTVNTTEQTSTNEDMDQTVTSNSTERTVEDNTANETENTNTDTTRDTDATAKVTDDNEWHEEGQEEKTTDFTENVTNDNEWHEEGHEDQATDEIETSGSSENTGVSTHSESFSKSREDGATSEATDVKQTETGKTGTDNESKTFGFMNVSPSQLLAQFRETFLNIDDMIIEELRPLFMEVF